MKLLFLTSDWKWTGPAEPMVHAITGLRALGHQVDAAFPATPPGYGEALAERAAARGVVAVYQPARGQGFGPLRDAGETRRLRAFLRAGGYDAVHAFHARAQLLARFALGARRGRPKLVASWTHGEPIPPRPWNRWLYGPRGCDGLALLTEALAERTRAWLGPTRQCVGVIPGVVDTERFAPRPRRAELAESLGLKPEQRVLGLVARLQPHRRVDLILEALRRALVEAPGLRLLVIGRGTRAAEVLDGPVRRLGLQHAVVRAGYLRGDAYLDALAAIDALVYLVPGSDGSCRAALEAMAMGIPVIASRRGILPELVLGGAGLGCDEDPAALASAFASVASDPQGWRARGEAARERARAGFGIARSARASEALYRSVVGNEPEK